MEREVYGHRKKNTKTNNLWEKMYEFVFQRIEITKKYSIKRMIKIGYYGIAFTFTKIAGHWVIAHKWIRIIITMFFKQVGVEVCL